MQYSKKANPFYEIDYSDKIVFFEEDTNKLELIDDSFKFIRLNNKTLANTVMNTYKIEKLPCVRFYNQNIYLDEDFQKEMKAVELDVDKILEKRINDLIKSAKIVLFMKGSVEEPYCRFSKALVEILKSLNCDMESVVYYDVLMNKEMREKIKSYNQWPTFPQLFVNSEFVGGYDIICELHNTKELENLLH
jgi:Grx4 family monothiol glutaredoxin